jgi:hypothetical protein
MKIIGNSIHFKSYPEMYQKEKSGRKPNTVRGFENSNEAEESVISDVSYICIHSNTGEYFQRKLTDISIFKGRIIFSWSPK